MSVSCIRWLISLQKSFTTLDSAPSGSRRASRESVRQLLSRVISTSMKCCASRWRTAGSRPREAQEVVEQHPVDDELARRRAALVREGRAGDRPAIVLGADQLGPRDE